MAIDPITGQEIPQPNAQNITAGIGMDIAEGYGLDPMANSTLFNTLSHIPTVYQTAGWNAWRGANTITRGGFAPGRGTKGMFRGGILNNLTPPAMMRMSDPSLLIGGSSQKYSPVEVMANMSNWSANKAAGFGMRSMADGSSRAGQGIHAWMTRNELIPKGFDPNVKPARNQFFSPGMASRLTAARRMAGADPTSRKGAARAANTRNFLRMQSQSAFDISAGMTGSQLGAFQAGAIQGTFSQGIGGYMTGVTGQADEAVRAGWNASGHNVAARFAEKAGTHLGYGGITAGEKIGIGGFKKGIGMAGERAAAAGVKYGAAKFAGAAGLRAAGLAIPYVNVAMAAWMAVDVLKMGASLLTKAPDLAKDSIKSFKGQIDKPVFGMGYKDTAVAATSRARGVMAIQNSRLNARSVLGTEASYMNAHFG